MYHFVLCSVLFNCIPLSAIWLLRCLHTFSHYKSFFIWSFFSLKSSIFTSSCHQHSLLIPMIYHVYFSYHKSCAQWQKICMVMLLFILINVISLPAAAVSELLHRQWVLYWVWVPFVVKECMGCVSGGDEWNKIVLYSDLSLFHSDMQGRKMCSCHLSVSKSFHTMVFCMPYPNVNCICLQNIKALFFVMEWKHWWGCRQKQLMHDGQRELCGHMTNNYVYSTLASWRKDTNISQLCFYFSARAKIFHHRKWHGEHHVVGCDVDLPSFCPLPHEAQLSALWPQCQACKQ